MNAAICILAAIGRARCIEENKPQETDAARTTTIVNVAPIQSSAEHVRVTYLKTPTAAGKTTVLSDNGVSGLSGN